MPMANEQRVVPLYSAGIVARLILSVDRRNALAEALDTVKLAAEYQSRGVVGVDFSGNPEIGHARDFVQAWDMARYVTLDLLFFKS
jgi:hypothetical protein